MQLMEQDQDGCSREMDREYWMTINKLYSDVECWMVKKQRFIFLSVVRKQQFTK